MIRILNQNLEVEANLKPKGKSKVLMANLTEQINREYKLDFEVIVDNEKSQYVNTDHIVEVEEDYFDIVYTKKRQDSRGKFIQGQAEHVSYRLNQPEYDLEFFTEDNTPDNILEAILEDTDFTVGTVEFTEQEVFSIQEESSRRSILVQFAEYLGGELQFNKFEISIVQARGQDNGVRFKVGKNIIGVEEEVDKRDGDLQVAYDVDVVDLSECPRYKELGYAELEKVNLGDTVRVIAPEIGIDEPQRVVSRTKDLIRRENLNVQIANFFDDLSDDIHRIRRDTVAKDVIYNGIRIGPDVGFLAETNNKLARNINNATEGFRLQKGDGTGDNYEDVLFFDINEQEYLFDGNIVMRNGTITWDNVNSDPATEEAREIAEAIAEGTYFGGTFIDGTTIFSPTIGAGSFIGGDIDIGNGTFTVDSGGNMEATSAYIQGIIEASEFWGGRINIGNGAFEVLNNGSLFATNAYIEGEIFGSDIFGSDIFGSNIIGGQIDVSTDLYVGRNIFLDEGTDNNKRIEFTDRNDGAWLEYSSGGFLSIFSWGELDLAAPFVNIGGSQETTIGNANADVLFFGDIDMTFANEINLPENTYIPSLPGDNLVATLQDIDNAIQSHVATFHS